MCPRYAGGPLIKTSYPLLRHELRCLAAAVLARDHTEVQVHLQPYPRPAGVKQTSDAPCHLIAHSTHMHTRLAASAAQQVASSGRLPAGADTEEAWLHTSVQQTRASGPLGTWQPSARVAACRARMPTSPITLPLVPTRMARTCGPGECVIKYRHVQSTCSASVAITRPTARLCIVVPRQIAVSALEPLGSRCPCGTRTQ